MRRILASTLTIATALLLINLGPSALADGSEDPGSVKFRGGSFPVKEEAGAVKIVVRRHRGSDGEVSVDYTTTNGTALAGEDYITTAGTLVWKDGDRKDKTFKVSIVDDDEDEGTETFGVLLANPTGDLEIGQLSSTVVRIKSSDGSDDDSDSEDSDSEDSDSEDSDDNADSEDGPGCLKLTRLFYPAFESSGEASFTVERDDGDTGPVTVDWMLIDGSATSPEDYLNDGLGGTLSWADGEDGEMTVSVVLVNDTEEEDLETITVVLTNPTGGACLGKRDMASILIIDDDGEDGSCVADENTLCLRDGRFQVTGSWRDFDGNEGLFHAVPATDGAGLVWFFDEDNIELLVKVLNGCALNGHFWVFFAAITNVEFTMEVTDLESGLVKVYTNPLGVVPLATTDVTAFPSCS